MAWRAAWADEVNLCLEQKGLEERIDHRSFVDQGKAEQPTIHEGVVARVLGDKGIVSDRCELNRQIRRDNALLRQLKAEVQRLVEAVRNSITALSKASERLRANMIVFAYQVLHARRMQKQAKQEIHRIAPKLIKYNELVAQIRAKQKEKKALLAKKKDMSFFQTFELIKVNALIVEATEDLEELKSEKEQVMSSLGKYDVKGMQDVKAWIDGREKEIQKTKTSEANYSAELDKALNEYHNLEVRAEELEPEELQAARLSLRPEEEQRAVSALENAYGASYDPAATRDAKKRLPICWAESTTTPRLRSSVRISGRSRNRHCSMRFR